MIREEEQALHALPALRVSDVLAKLNETRQRVKRGQKESIPYCTLHLRSGRDLRGWILDVAESADQSSVLLHVSENETTPRADVCYVAMREIEAVSVHNLAAFATILSNGAIEVPPGVQVPTRRGIHQRTLEWANTIGERLDKEVSFEVDFDTFAEDDRARFQLSRWVEHLGAVLLNLMYDNTGQVTIRDHVNKVTLRHADQLRVTLENGVLQVEGDTPPTEPELEGVIAEVL
ncbi:MAG: hypothetical protein OHK0029_18870 [Armatimonadaceae bacterium]